MLYSHRILLLITFLGICGGGASLWAADIPVSSIADDGPGTLREAIANALPGDRIIFDAVTDGNPIVLSTPLTITKILTINGNGMDATYISGGDVTNVFDIVGVDSITIRDLSIIDGFRLYCGGGLLVDESNLSLISTRISGNQARSGGGGDMHLFW